MRVLGVLAAWSVLAVLATLCFAVGGSIGYRRGVQDAVRQLRERRSGKTGCRPLPLPHHRRRPITRMHASPMRAAEAKAAAPPAIHRLRAQFSRSNLSPVLAGAMATVFLLALPGAALGATTAQPGEALWPVKRGMESARLAMATSPDRDLQIHVELASRRLSELDQLLTAEATDPQVVDAVITDLRGHTEAASERLREVEVTERREAADRVEEVVHRQVMKIEVLLDVDCADVTGDDKCVALGDTHVAAKQLHDETVTVAMTDSDAGRATQQSVAASAAADDGRSESGAVSATARPATPPDTATAAAASAQDGQGNSGGVGNAAPSERASASPSPSPSPSPSSTPSRGTTTTPAAAAAGNEEPATDPAPAAAEPAGDGTGGGNGRGNGGGSDATKPAEQPTAKPTP